ncbi:MAG: NINE protein [Azospirillaceae bacterium]|nr:NINE protein [Azospirillaceae bacterium]
MQGTVLSYSRATGHGIIGGADNQRYTFQQGEWLSELAPAAGRRLDFVGINGVASQIYTIDPMGAEKSKLVASALAVFLGSLGLHKFYLGYSVTGFVMLLAFVLGFVFMGIPSLIVGAIGLIEGVLYLVKSDAEFETLYVRGKRRWF